MLASRLRTPLSRLLFVTLLAVGTQSEAKEFAFFHENVLGTSLELRIDAESGEIATRAEEVALKEIDRLSELFSHYSPSSEFAKLSNLPVGKSIRVSPELTRLLQKCDQWNQLSNGAFNPGVELLSRRWKEGLKDNSVPNVHELGEIIRSVNQPHWRIDSTTESVTRSSSVPLSLNAIAKGTVLDSVSRKVIARVPETVGISINIGGDILVAGNSSQMVSIPDPNRDMLEAMPIQNLSLDHGAIATSGVSERSIKIGSQSYSHILDPKTGYPCGHVVSASVIAKDAETADVLATICSVLPTSASLALIESIPGAKCLLVDFHGALFASSLWPTVGLQEGSKKGESAKTTDGATEEFNIAFEINKASEGGRYRRPYVAVWVEDKDGFPVKTLSLFLMADNPGPRWHRDLRRWYSSDQVRLLVDQKKLIGTVSKPTRNPGAYKVAWDGKDDNGKALPDGQYTLYIEAAREHGTYQLMKSPFSLGSGDFDLKLDGNVEIKSATMSFKKKK